MTDIIICDIDGVFTDSSDWYNYYPVENTRELWNEFQSKCRECCKPNKRFIEYMKEVYKDKFIIFLTAREETPYLLEETVRQIEEFSDGFYKVGENCSLVMRPLNNFLEDYKVKEMLLLDLMHFFNISLAIDDNIDNINMYRSHNIETYWYMDLLDE